LEPALHGCIFGSGAVFLHSPLHQREKAWAPPGFPKLYDASIKSQQDHARDTLLAKMKKAKLFCLADYQKELL
jgi:hypothetical protein